MHEQYLEFHQIIDLYFSKLNATSTDNVFKAADEAGGHCGLREDKLRRVFIRVLNEEIGTSFDRP